MTTRVLHDDTPDREGNLSAAEYRSRQDARRREQGDNGLHIIPPDVLAAAESRLGK